MDDTFWIAFQTLVIRYETFKDSSSVWKKLCILQETKQQNTYFITKLLQFGHIELATSNDIDIKSSDSFHFPSYFVTKADGTTTKLRVVFDASPMFKLFWQQNYPHGRTGTPELHARQFYSTSIRQVFA